jgi:hypothetical protein
LDTRPACTGIAVILAARGGTSLVPPDALAPRAAFGAFRVDTLDVTAPSHEDSGGNLHNRST